MAKENIQIAQEIRADEVVARKAEQLRQQEKFETPLPQTNYDELARDAAQNALDRLNAIPFINAALSRLIVIAARSLLIVGGYTNTGKTTSAALIIYPVLLKKMRVGYFSNEELRSDFIIRLGCIHLGMSYGGFKSNPPIYSDEDKARAFKAGRELADGYLTCHDPISSDGRTESREGLKSMLEEAKGKFSLVIIDSFTDVTSIGMTSESKTWEELYKFSQYLKRLKHTIGCPIVVTCQLQDPENGKGWLHCLCGGKQIGRDATDALFIAREGDDPETFYLVKKARFADTRMSAVGVYTKGRVEILRTGTATELKAWMKDREARSSGPIPGKVDQ